MVEDARSILLGVFLQELRRILDFEHSRDQIQGSEFFIGKGNS